MCRDLVRFVCVTSVFLCVASGVYAQSGQPSPLQLRSSTQLNQSSERPSAASTTTQSAAAAVPGDSLGRLPESLITGLVLDAGQRAKLEAAHEARRKMWIANRNARQAEYAALTEELSTDKFDPRAAVALRKKTRAKIDASFDDVQASWLAFWDVLNEPQRKILIGYMRDQHAIQGKASAAASAERTAARAKQQAAVDRAEARAAQQQGATAPATGSGAPK